MPKHRAAEHPLCLGQNTMSELKNACPGASCFPERTSVSGIEDSGLGVDLMYERSGVAFRVRLSWATFNTRIGCPTKADIRPPSDLGMEMATNS